MLPTALFQIRFPKGLLRRASRAARKKRKAFNSMVMVAGIYNLLYGSGRYGVLKKLTTPSLSRLALQEQIHRVTRSILLPAQYGTFEKVASGMPMPDGFNECLFQKDSVRHPARPCSRCPQPLLPGGRFYPAHRRQQTRLPHWSLPYQDLFLYTRFIHIQPLFKNRGVRFMPDGYKKAFDRNVGQFAGFIVFYTHPFHGFVAQYFVCFGVPVNFNVLRLFHPVLHYFTGPHFIRRISMCTVEQSFERYNASSAAVSPAPTIATSLPRKKKPSHTAQALTP
jgi:hypothetical protein